MRFLHDHLYSLLAALILVAATSIWFVTPEPTQPKSISATAEPWSLPKLAENVSKKSLETISDRNLWGIVAVNAVVIKEPEWRVLGIARSGAERFILLAFEGKPVEMLKVGDALPDGVKIVQIENDRFFVMTADKKKLAFGIYKNESAK
jgi:hypothetical protein